MFAIYTDQAPHRTHYVPSGYMGDSDLAMSGAYVDTPNGKGPCLRVVYRGTGNKGWSGLYWQDPANNWGTVPVSHNPHVLGNLVLVPFFQATPVS